MASVGSASASARSAEEAAAKAAAVEPRLLNALLHPSLWCRQRKSVREMVLPMGLDWGLYAHTFMTLRHVDMLCYAMNEEMRTRLHDHEQDLPEDLERKLRAIAHVVGDVLKAMAGGIKAHAFDGVLLRKITGRMEEVCACGMAYSLHLEGVGIPNCLVASR